MSVRAVTWALEQDELTDAEKLLLVLLADHADNDGLCWPGRRMLAERAGKAKGTVTKLLGSLEKKGRVQRIPQFRDNGSQSSNLYFLPCSDSSTPPADVVEKAQNEHPPSPTASTLEPPTEPKVSVPVQQGQQAVIGLSDDAIDLLRQKPKVNSRLVTENEMAIADRALQKFNELAGLDYGLGAALTPIVGRIRERPSYDAEAHERLVEAAFRERWWEKNGRAGKRPTPGVIYGNAKVFENVVQDAVDRKKGRDPTKRQGRFAGAATR